MAKSTSTSGTTGHRQRLRDRYLAGDPEAYSDEALLELLLTYAIPQQDVQPLAHTLLERFGDLTSTLGAELAALCETPGLKITSALLLKLVDYLRTGRPGERVEGPRRSYTPDGQLSLFDAPEASQMPSELGSEPVLAPAPPPVKKAAPKRTPPPARPRSEIFTTAFLRDAIDAIPTLPDTDSVEEMGDQLQRTLRYSASQSRQRVASYVMKRMFPTGTPDRALLLFARQYANRQEWRDVAFYRFCIAEPLTVTVMQDVLLPEIGAGRIERSHIRTYLAGRFPASKSVLKCVQAFADALTPANIATADRKAINFAYRDILLPSFAFVLHSEFPAPGMYDIGKLEVNRAIRALLWSPERMLPALYELRNTGIISKVSQIDSVRQFTTRMTLDEVVGAEMGSETRI